MKPLRDCFGPCFALVLATLLAGCASTSPPLPPSLELPKPPTDLRATRKGNRVYLTWSVPTLTTDRQTIRNLGPTRICRSLETAMTRCENPVGESPAPHAPPRPSKTNAVSAPQSTRATYTDTLPPQLGQQNPTAMVTYAVEVLNSSNRGAGLSNQARVPAVPTLPPPEGFTAQLTSEGIVLSWRGMADTHQFPVVSHRYRVYRREVGSSNEALVGELPMENESEMRLVDHGFEWEKTYDYRATVLTSVSEPGKPEIQVEGDDTLVVRVFAHDIFPPAVPRGLEAVFSGTGQQLFIDLIWAPDADADLAGYNVYRHEEGGAPAKINTDLVKTPAYRDSNVAPGKKYFYSVSAIDLRGNESAPSEEASDTVPKETFTN